MITNNSYRIHQIGCRILLGIALQIGVGGERLLAQPPTEVESIVVPVDAADTPMPHFWEQMFGSGRAILSLRDSYRQDLRAVKAVTDLRYVRFHNILHDEVGLFHIDASGRPVYNFSYVDQIYDGLLENGIRPFIEIDFMPFELSSNRKSVIYLC